MYQCQLYKNYYFLLMIQGSLFSLEHDHKNVAVVGGLLTQLRFNFSIFPIVTDVAAYLYSNLTLPLNTIIKMAPPVITTARRSNVKLLYKYAATSVTIGADESGSGMGFLNFSCFLAEGIGIAVVGGLLTQLRFNFSIFNDPRKPFLP
jgi:hypothetical protein